MQSVSFEFLEMDAGFVEEAVVVLAEGAEIGAAIVGPNGMLRPLAWLNYPVASPGRYRIQLVVSRVADH